MRAFFAKHFAVIVTGTVFNFPFLWKGGIWLTDWLARFDFWATHGPEIRPMIGFITNPPPWMVFVTSIMGVAIVLWDVRYPNTLPKIAATLKAPKNRMAIFVGLSIAFLLLGSGFGVAAYWQYRYPAPLPKQETALFKAARDSFQMSGGIGMETENIKIPKIANEQFPITIWIRSDLISMATYLVFYVPHVFDMPPMPNQGDFPTRQTFEILKVMADRFGDVMKRNAAHSGAGLSDANGENMRDSSQAPFTGAIYVYYEGRLTEDERVQLRGLYAQRQARVFFCDNSYLAGSIARKN